MPARHVLQFTARPSLKVPASQLMQALAPLSDPVAKPAMQSLHSCAPEVLWYFPDTHDEQDIDPSREKVPAGQLAQLELADKAANVPLEQSSHALWPEALWNRPLEHSLQLVEPVVAATFPASHAVQLKLLLEAE